MSSLTVVKIQFISAKHPLIDLPPGDELNFPPFESPTKLNDLLLRNDHEREKIVTLLANTKGAMCSKLNHQ